MFWNLDYTPSEKKTNWYKKLEAPCCYALEKKNKIDKIKGVSLSISVLEKHRLHMRSKCLVPDHKDSSIAFLIYLSDILSIQTVFEIIQSIYMVYLFKNYCNIWLYDFWVTEKLINHLSSHAGELLACSSRSIYKFVTSEWNLCIR